MNTTVPTTPADREPDYYAEIAAELHRIADDLAKIGPGAPKPYFGIAIQPGTGIRDDDERIIAAVDTVSVALTGAVGKVQLMSDGDTRHYKSKDFFKRGLLTVDVYQAISSKTKADAIEAQRAKDAELVQLRAENGRLRAAAPSFVDDDPTGLGFSREADDPTPTTAVPATVEGHAEFSGRATVPPLCRHVAEVSGVPCNRPLEWLPGAWWVHVDETGIDHPADGPETDGE